MPNKMKKRRTKAEIEQLKKRIYEILNNYHPQSDRQLYYQMVKDGSNPKTEAAYQGVVLRLCGRMRETGELPWSWITDSTRWMRKPRSFTSLSEALENTKETYRRALWDDQPIYVEIWTEKEALASIFFQVTAEWDVPLMVVKGFTSKAFAHSAAEAIDARGKPAFLYYFGDLDQTRVWEVKK